MNVIAIIFTTEERKKKESKNKIMPWGKKKKQNKKATEAESVLCNIILYAVMPKARGREEGCAVGWDGMGRVC